MGYDSRYGVTKNTKTRIITFTTALVLAVSAMSAAMPTFLSGNASAATLYSADFEDGSYGNWQGYSSNGSIPAGNVSVVNGAAASGANYAKITGPAYTNWGSYKSAFPSAGYTTSVAVYLDTALATGSNDLRFDFSSAINKKSGTHLRDFVFTVGTDPTTANQFLVNTGNGVPGNPATAGNVAVTTAGWYTLKSNFHNDGSGNLAVRMSLVTNGGTVLKNWDIATTDSITSTDPNSVGGNRYGWFTDQQFGINPLSIDNASLSTNPVPTDVYVNSAYTFSGTNGGHLFGYDAFSTIESALNTVAANTTIHVAPGVYNVQANGVYANNLTVDGADMAIINGLDLTGATFNGLTFKNFNFVGDSAGYGNNTVTIGNDGNYANLAIVSSAFDGENVPGRGAIFVNRGFDGFALLENTFKNYVDTAPSIYSVVFVEAQGPTMGNHFTATSNSLTNSNVPNFIETYRWQNVQVTNNTVNAQTGRILVWSDDTDSLGTVTIAGNNFTVTEGTGIGVFYAPNTTANITGNIVDGADICLKVNSVSTSVIQNNTAKNCGVALAIAETGDTVPVSTTVTGNAFAGPVENTSSQTVDVSNNNVCADSNCNSYVPKPTTPVTPTPAKTTTTTSAPATARTTAVTRTVAASTSDDASNAGVEAAANVLGAASGIAATSTPTKDKAATTTKTTEDSSNFLGLGWWWLLVGAVVLAVLGYLAAARRTNNA